jgi:hypothetical protein
MEALSRSWSRMVNHYDFNSAVRNIYVGKPLKSMISEAKSPMLTNRSSGLAKAVGASNLAAPRLNYSAAASCLGLIT